MKTLTVLLLLVTSLPSYAYKFSIYTDQADKSKAQAVIDKLSQTYPFNQFEIEYDIVTVPASDLDCAPLNGIERAMACNSENIASRVAARGVDQAMIIKDHPNYGGTGGNIPVMTSSSPVEVAVHEYLHALGLCDEYKYAASETTLYCTEQGAGLNMVFIEPNPQGYASDADARRQHMGSIPWAGAIKDETPITRASDLGTGVVSLTVMSTPNNTSEPSRMGAAIGLYEGQTCKEATPAKKTWQPGGETTIMDKLEAGLGAGNEYLVAKALESRGARKKIVVAENAEIFVNNTKREAEVLYNYLPHENNQNATGVTK